MIRIDLSALFERLNPAFRHALEEASSLCIAHRGAEVTAAHWRLKLLDNPFSDVQILLKHGADAARQARAVPLRHWQPCSGRPAESFL